MIPLVVDIPLAAVVAEAATCLAPTMMKAKVKPQEAMGLLLKARTVREHCYLVNISGTVPSWMRKSILSCLTGLRLALHVSPSDGSNHDLSFCPTHILHARVLDITYRDSIIPIDVLAVSSVLDHQQDPTIGT